MDDLVVYSSSLTEHLGYLEEEIGEDRFHLEY
jgi:hypothetical protein